MNPQFMIPNPQSETLYQSQPTHMHPHYDSYNRSLSISSNTTNIPSNHNMVQNGPYPPMYPQAGHNQNGLPPPPAQVKQMQQMPPPMTSMPPMPPSTSGQMAMRFPHPPPQRPPGQVSHPNQFGSHGEIYIQRQYGGLPQQMVPLPLKCDGTPIIHAVSNTVANMDLADSQKIYPGSPQMDGGQYQRSGFCLPSIVSSGPSSGPLPAQMNNQFPTQSLRPQRQTFGSQMIQYPGRMSGGPSLDPSIQRGNMASGLEMESRFPTAQLAGLSLEMQQQPRRLHQFPSPILFIEDDKKHRSGLFITNVCGQIPPLVTTDFITQDRGNCNPRFIRSSIYSVPTSVDLLKQTSLPFVVTISPFAKLHSREYPPPVVDLGELGPVRCVRCKAYVCPFMQFIDNGRIFQCGLCKATTEVPPEYFAHLDHTGQRLDKFVRSELCLGSYEFVATKEYCKNNVLPKPPAFIFVIDVSFSNVKNGMFNLLCQNIKEILREIPKEENVRPKVGFITYNDTVHFYNVKSTLVQPQMLVVSDVHDMFMPLLDGFLVDALESEAIIDLLMEQIKTIFSDTRDTETILGPAIQAGLEALKAADCSGKLLVFHSNLPIAEAPGKLKSPDDGKLLGTETEKMILKPERSFYTQLGQDCVTAGCSVDLFVFPTNFIDIATIGQVSRLTGGQVYKYTYFQADIDGIRFLTDLKRSIRCTTAFDAIMRVRTSTGVRPTNFFGSYYMSNTTDIELASVDCDKAISVEIKHDDKLTEEDAVYIQAAILFTSVGGQRRLRIHNLSLNTCTQMADLYRNCELDTIINYFAKSALRQLIDDEPKRVKDQLISRCAQILVIYRKYFARSFLPGQTLLFPTNLRLLPLYVNCLLKSDVIFGGLELFVDERSFMVISLSSMDVKSSVALFYPRLLPLHDVDVDFEDLPVALRCSYDQLQEDGVYLLENGIYMFMWIGMNVASDWLQSVFSIQSSAQADVDRIKLTNFDNSFPLRIWNIIDKVQSERQRCMKLTVVRQGDKLEMVFKRFLVEDKGLVDNSPSYADFIGHLQKNIVTIFS